MKARTTKFTRAAWICIAFIVPMVGFCILVGQHLNDSEAVGGPHGRASRKPLYMKRSSDEERLAALEREVRRLQGIIVRQHQFRREAKSDEEVSAVELRKNEVSQPSQPSQPELSTPEEAEAKRREFLDELSGKLDKEPYDNRWRSETETALARIIPDSFGPDVVLDGVACVSSVCRATLSHPGMERLPPDGIMTFLSQRGPALNLQIQFDVRDDGITSLYFLRSESEEQ